VPLIGSLTEQGLRVAEFAQALLAAGTVDEVFERVAERVPGAVGAERAAVIMRPEQDSSGPEVHSAIEDVFRSGDPVVIGDAAECRTLYQAAGTDKSPGGAIAVFPIAGDVGSPSAVLSLEWDRSVSFDEGLVAVMSMITDMTAQKLERVRLADDLTLVVERLSGLALLADSLAGVSSVADLFAFVGLSGFLPIDPIAVSIGLVDREANIFRRRFLGRFDEEFALELESEPLDGPGPMVASARTGEHFFFLDPNSIEATRPRSFEVLEPQGYGAAAVLPLTGLTGERFGSVMVGWSQPVDFDEGLLASLSTMSAMFAQALERARLTDDLALQGRHNEALARFAEAMAGAAAVADVVGQITRLLPGVLDGVAAAVGLIDREANVLRRHFGGVVDEGIAQEYATQSLDSSMPLVDSARSGTTWLFPNRDAVAASHPETLGVFDAAGYSAYSATPLRDRDGELIGSLMVGWAHPVVFHEGLVTRLRTVTELVAQTLERTRLADDLASQSRQNEVLARFAEALAGAATMGDVITRITARVPATLGGAFSAVGLIDREANVLNRFLGGPLDDQAAQKYSTQPLDSSVPMIDSATIGTTWLFPDRDAYEAAFPETVEMFDAAGFSSAATLPFRDQDGELVGSLMVGWDHPVIFDEARVTRLRTVTELVAQTLERAQLSDAAVRDAARSERLASFSRTLTLATSPSQMVDVVVAHLPAVIDATSVTLEMKDDESRSTRFASAGAEPTVREHPAGGVAVQMPIPLVSADGWMQGLLTIDWESHSFVDERVRSTLATVTEMITVTIQRVRLSAAEHRLIADLQRRALIPAPPTPGLEVAAHYQPSQTALRVGGDWFQGVSLGEGRLGLIVGDVVGHGARAAGDMMQLSGTLATLLGVGTPLDRLFTLVHDAVGPLGIMATVVVCEIDPVDAVLRYVSAGHPPLLMVAPDATMTMLNDGRRPLVGVSGTDVVVGECPFPVGSTLVAYTDGLVERRGEHFDVGLGRMRDAVRTSMGLELEAQLDMVVQRCTENHLVEDDVAVVAVRSVPR